MPDVVVVGGGIIGAACAFELADRGASVTLLER
jgi:glycine/D-amino acid oxidase-like deaminating enzyme